MWCGFLLSLQALSPLWRLRHPPEHIWHSSSRPAFKNSVKPHPRLMILWICNQLCFVLFIASIPPLLQTLCPQHLLYLPERSCMCPHLHLLLGTCVWREKCCNHTLTNNRSKGHLTEFSLCSITQCDKKRSATIRENYPASSGSRRSNRAACFWAISEDSSEWAIKSLNL